MIAALFVETNGCYFGMPNVDPWDKQRDARKYAGPHRVIAHPPCERWGSHWFLGGRCLGDDDGCFEAAIVAVRRWGGVIEHPARSGAWNHWGLNRPPQCGGWVVADWFGGWTCSVEQGLYGHRVRKPTWLYACGIEISPLKWRRKVGEFLHWDLLPHKERKITPLKFRDLLISMVDQ